MAHHARSGRGSLPAGRRHRIPARRTDRAGSSPRPNSSSRYRYRRRAEAPVPDGSAFRAASGGSADVGAAGVTPPGGGGGFGRSALRFHGRIFAMLVRGRLVVKLPAERVDELIEAGDGVRFDANKGTPMREWLSLDPDSGEDWLELAREALDFAGSR